MMLKTFFRRISKDFRQKELMPLKLIFFVQTSTLFILYPYLTIHMRELGINVEETAVMSALTPFVAIIMPPVAGLIADRIGNFKILLSLFSALGGAASLLLLLVPISRVTVQLPASVILGASCPDPLTGSLVYSMSQEHPCETLRQVEVDATLRSCGYTCSLSEHNESEIKEILRSRSYQISLFNPDETKNVTYEYSISETDMPECSRIPQDFTVNRKVKNMEYYGVAIRQMSKNSYFFPASELFEMNCNSSENYLKCGFETLVLPPKNTELTFRTGLKALKLSEADNLEKRRRYLAQGVDWRDGGNRSVRCSQPQERATIKVDLRNGDEVVYAEECSRSCLVTAPRNKICTNKSMLIEYNARLTFWSYLVIRVFISMIGGTAFAMFEGAVIAILREQKADYGLQRIYGNIGGIISSPLSGLLIDYASRGKEYADYRPAFYLYATLKIFSGFLMLLINLEFKVPAQNVVKDVVSVLTNIEVTALLTACFILGTAWGYIESFLFWLLEDLGASRLLMGSTITVGGIAGIPLLVMSGPLISKVGHANVIFIGFIFYAIRLIGYSLITKPWQSLIFEALESVTSSLSFTAAVTYAAKLSTTTTDTSIQGLLGGLYYGVGKGLGSLIGGFLMNAVGTRPTYRIFAAMTFVTGVCYLLFNLLYLQKRPQTEGNDIVKKEPKPDKKPPTIKDVENNKEKIAQAEESMPYFVDDIEAINNAKNLDIVECFEEGEDDNDNHGVRQRHGGQVNPSFEPDEVTGGRVTIEKGSS